MFITHFNINILCLTFQLAKYCVFDFQVTYATLLHIFHSLWKHCYQIVFFLPDIVHCPPPPETSATSIHLQITPAFVFFSHYKCKDSCFPPLPLLQLPILLFSELLAGNFMCLGHFLQMTNHFPFSYMDNLQEVKFKIKISCLKFISYKLSRPVLYNGLYHWQQTPPFKMKNKF